MKTSHNYLNLIAIACLLPAGIALAHENPPKGYATDANGHVVRNSFNECWRTSSWAPELAIEECDPDLVKKTPPKKEAPAPVAVVTAPVAAPAPAPKPAPAPQPKESWKTILTEKPVRLEGANFATNSASLLKTADVKLNEVVNAARQYPEVKLDVSGHTDNIGKQKLNQKLSDNRAAAVKAWLVKHGVAADRISTSGYADTQPIADNKTKEGRATNRRVEVRYVIKEEKKIRVTE